MSGEQSGWDAAVAERTSLTAEIEAAFEGTVYPGNDELVHADEKHLERVRIREAFRGLEWCDVPLATLVREDAALAFFTPEAFRYYLPAYLLAVLHHFRDAGVLPGTVVRHLTLPLAEDSERERDFLDAYPELYGASDVRQHIAAMAGSAPGLDERERFFLERMAPLTPEQGRAVRHFLDHLDRYYRDEYPFDEPRTAVERYWFVHSG